MKDADVTDLLPVTAGSRVLVVCAHPDDESFGLGAIIATMVGSGAEVHVVCLTRGEASTLRDAAHDDLGEVRARELDEAAGVLGITSTTLLDHPDGGLDDVPDERLLADVSEVAERTRPGLLLVFDPEGITGHPDHRRATSVALDLASRRDLEVLAWVLPATVARRLNDELGTTFLGRPRTDVDLTFQVDRTVQLEAIGCHRSQERDNPALRRRLELLGDREHLRWLDPNVPR